AHPEGPREQAQEREPVPAGPDPAPAMLALHESLKAGRQSGEIQPPATDQTLEIIRCGDPYFVAGSLQAEPQGDIRLYVTTRTERQDRDAHASLLNVMDGIYGPEGGARERLAGVPTCGARRCVRQISTACATPSSARMRSPRDAARARRRASS